MQGSKIIIHLINKIVFFFFINVGLQVIGLIDEILQFRHVYLVILLNISSNLINYILWTRMKEHLIPHNILPVMN